MAADPDPDPIVAIDIDTLTIAVCNSYNRTCAYGADEVTSLDDVCEEHRRMAVDLVQSGAVRLLSEVSDRVTLRVVDEIIREGLATAANRLHEKYHPK